ncbi:hypothetical protein FRB96_003757 [Tulasnella sp. 330]|nr:hypothetical protein FRB96_003757 [Tulasnella sp. 330]
MWARILVTVSLVLSALSASLPVVELPNVTRSIASGTFSAGLRIVENSGVCETTPGVHTVSGYIDVNNNENYFSWFFSSRQTTKASIAPLVLWFNGGPGSSSMIGLFQENGPCKVNSDEQTTTINHSSWNAVANVMYIDQPIGAGLFHGTENADISKSAASKIWVMLQTFFETWPQYEGRELILATESYGGHYGPEFNKRIRLGNLKGEAITVSAVMLNKYVVFVGNLPGPLVYATSVNCSGWIDPLTQYGSYPAFAAHPPGYTPFISTTVFNQATTSMRESGGCGDKVKECNAAGGSNNACNEDTIFVTEFVFIPSLGNRDPYDIRSARPNPLPPAGYINYLQQPNIQKAIGAEVTFSESNGAVFFTFVTEGDFYSSFLYMLIPPLPKLYDFPLLFYFLNDKFTKTLLLRLATLADSKLKILIWYGDADYICNWVGGLALTREMEWYGKKGSEMRTSRTS